MLPAPTARSGVPANSARPSACRSLTPHTTGGHGCSLGQATSSLGDSVFSPASLILSQPPKWSALASYCCDGIRAGHTTPLHRPGTEAEIKGWSFRALTEDPTTFSFSLRPLA